MKKHLYPLFFGLFLSILMVSCSEQQDEKLENDRIYEISAERYLDLNFQQEVLFRYEYENIETNQKLGWLIDRNGIIRDYNYEDAGLRVTDQNECSRSSLMALYQSSVATESRIDLEELAESAKLISSTATGNISELQVQNSDDQMKESYFVYNKTEEQSTAGGHSCGNGITPTDISASSQMESSYEQVVLKVTGSHVQDNSHSNATKLYDWMKDIKENLQ